MTVEQRMGKGEQEADGYMTPLLKKKLFEQRNVFSPGHRIRMNIVPMFLMTFVPWGIFIFMCGNCAFYVMYMRPFLGWSMVALGVAFWLVSILVALNRRKYDSEPGWYLFFAIMVGIAVFGGVERGTYIYDNYSFPFYQVKDLKVLTNVDPMKEKGQNVLDAGMFYFMNGSRMDAMRSWHFKQKTVYCVVPIVVQGTLHNENNIPLTQSFDFWAVGKDCCSTAASDFRCGEYNNPLARGGIRNMDNEDRAYYRLAVEQASALYRINANTPIFFEWAADPVAVTNEWNSAGFRKYIAWVAWMFIFFAFAMAMASAKFSFMPRAESVYGEEIHGDPDWQKGGFSSRPTDLHVHERHV